MKYTLVIIGVIAAMVVGLAWAVPAVAEDVPECGVLPQSICNSSTTTDKNDASKSGIYPLLIWVLRIMTGAVGVVAVGALTYAGITYSGAGSNAEQVTRAKRIITDTAIGLVVYGGMFLILNWLIPGGVFGS